MESTKRPFVLVLVSLAIIVAQFTNPQPAFASRLCGGVASTIYYVDVNSPDGTHDGCSWATAYRTLQDALTDETLHSGNKILVADGIYYPDEGSGQTDKDRASTFLLVNGVSIYGGYAGNGAADPDLRNPNPETNNTVLSGEIDGLAGLDFNAYHVVTADTITSITELSGFTIQEGNPLGNDGFGGGMYIYNSSSNLTVKGVIFTDNTAFSGGGMAAFFSSPTISQVVFKNNTILNYGGGFYNQDGSPILIDVTFDANRTLNSAAPGAGMHSTNSNPALYTVTPELTNVTFSNNVSEHGGGGGMFNNVSNAILINVTFTGNSADKRGGGMLNEGSNPILNNVTFSGNSAPAGTGAAMRNIDSDTIHSAPVIKNTILWEMGGDDIVNDAGNTVTINDSVMQDAACPVGGTCTNVKLNDDPFLSDLADNGGFTQTMAIGSGSSALDAGNNATCAPTNDDQRGVARPLDGDGNGTATCDIGAYEAPEQTITAIIADTPDPSTVGESVNITVTVSGGITTPTGTVDITGADTNCTITLAAGTGSCDLNFVTVGDKNLTAFYGGDATHATSSDTEAHTVDLATTITTITADAPDPSVVGQTVNVTVTVSGGITTPTGTVDIAGADTNCTITLDAGTGNCNANFVSVGAKTLNATYNGDATHATSSDTEAHAVDLPTTVTTITADAPDPSVAGQTVTVNFAVTSASGTPTGNVTVSDGVDSCIGTVAAATCNISLTTAGVRSLTATYAGDSNFAGSTTSAGEAHTVNQAALVDVYMGGGDPIGNYVLASGEERREYYDLSGGPVIVESKNEVDIVSAIRLQSMQGETLYSFVETMGVPTGLLSHKYYFPTYNNTWGPLNSQIRFGNLNADATTIRVTIGGDVVWEEDVPGLEERRLYFPVSGGPVIIESLNPAKKIVAAIRLQVASASGTLYSFAETMGIPDEYLSDTYYFPTYNNTWGPLNSQIRFGNLNADATTIRVTIGGDVVWEDDVPGLQERRLYFDVSGGPVKVESLDPTKKIVAAIRLQAAAASGTLYSFVETMGVPAGLLSHKYYFPTYNNTWAPLNSQIRFGNLNAETTRIRVNIGGTVVWEDDVPGLQERRLYFNVSGGPVIIESLDPTKKIVAAIRLQSMQGETLYSFSETMGIPDEQLSTTYYFPTYNNTWPPLNSQLRFGVP